MSDPKPIELLLATSNEGKVREYSALLPSLNFRLWKLSDYPWLSPPEETGETYLENAVGKAVWCAEMTRLPSLADDSGLEVEALSGSPGVLSARYGGLSTDRERMSLLLSELDATGDPERRARFVCIIAFFDPGSAQLATFTGECHGRIADVPRGSKGFGYDPIFVPVGFTQTFGELGEEIKLGISHRSKAVAAAAGFLEHAAASLGR